MSAPRFATDTIAITGIGLVTPAGVGKEATIAGLADYAPVAPEGDEGAAMPEPKIGRLPAGFRPRDWLKRKKDLKLMARPARLAVAAAKLAAADAGLADADDIADVGLFLGVGLEPGNIDDILPALAHSRDANGALDLDRLVDEGMQWMNPLSALKTLPNMAVAHASINLGAMGPGMALCAGPESGTIAIFEAAAAVAQGRAPWALAGAADAPIAFTDRLTHRRLGRHGPVAEGAAVFVLEPTQAALIRGARILATLSTAAGPGITAELPPANPFGWCGAATAAIAVGCALARGRTVSAWPVRLSRGVDARAPFIRLPPKAPPPAAITGIGLRTPLGVEFGAFCTALLSGRSGAAAIRAFDATHFPVKVACEVPDFSPRWLPDPLRKALEGIDDRKGELAVAAAVDAVADRGGIPSEAALVYASGLSSVSAQELAEDCLPFIDDGGHFDYARFARGPVAKKPQAPWRHLVDRPIGLLSRHLMLDGPRACHFSACAAGTAAIGHAADLIRRGEAPVALVGGADSMVHPFGLIPFILLGATSTQTDPDRAGRPFDQDRDGFVMGEGGAFFVLEPLDAARAAGRHVYGLVLGHGTSCDAYNVTAPHPEGAGAQRAMRAALADAELDPDRVGYINAHGTGTPLNDVIEAAAIRRIFGGDGPAVSSSKAQLGHAIAAAGTVELLACLAAFARGRLPPNPHTDRPDPRIDLDLVERDGRAATPAIILSNSFGFGGQNACLALGHPDLT